MEKKQRKTRAESFLGMHFDFHAGSNQENIGENCNPAAIERLLRTVKPDYVQCDTKGHVGATSYPTQVGYPAPHIKADLLKMWREETEKQNVALYAHHSGVWDNTAIKNHPEWAAVDENGIPSEQKNSVFGPYVDELLIPQLVEIATKYGLDGVWIDGECWAVMVDYSSYATQAYWERYQENPPKSTDENYGKYLTFCRQGFRDYVGHYLKEVHTKAPNFQIASNWMYTSFVPEEPLLPVDFISGDYSPNDSFNTARLEGRCLVSQGKPWDLMAWGFSLGDGYQCVKEYEQLCQEAAAIIALGGGFQFYNRQLVGTIQEWAIPMWGKVAEFCREREEFCFQATPVAQIGIVFSEKAFYWKKKDLFTCYSSHSVDDMRGVLYAVLDNQYSAEILMTHHLLNKGTLSDYGALLVPDLETIESELKEKLLDYVEKGGNLIIMGQNSTNVWKAYLGIEIQETMSTPTPIFVENDGKLGALKTAFQTISLAGATAVSSFYTDGFFDASLSKTAATVIDYGNGKIVGIYFNVGEYQRMKTAVVRDFIGTQIKSVFKNPLVTVKGSKLVEVIVMQKNGKLCINLLNTGGVHSDEKYKSFDEIPPLQDIEIEILSEIAPQAIYLEPHHIPMEYTLEDGKVQLVLHELAIHAILTVE